jgi:hypothetical protein
MSTKKKPTKAQALAAVQALIAGTQKHDPNGSYRIGNVVYSSAQLVTLLQSVATAMTQEMAAEQAAKDALTNLESLQATSHPIILGYRHALQISYGSASQILADYGLTPKKAPAPLTVQAKAAAAAKRKATREAGGKKSAKAAAATQGTTAAPAEHAPAAPTATPAKPTS